LSVPTALYVLGDDAANGFLQRPLR